MKITFVNILNPIIESPVSHVITGELPSGEKVEVSRRLSSSWEPILKVTVNGYVWHDTVPNKSEMTEFDKLRECASQARLAKADAALANSRAAAGNYLKA